MKKKIVIEPSYENVVVNYFQKVGEQELLKELSKLIRKESKEIAQKIVNDMDMRIYLRKDTKMIGTAIRKKYKHL